MLSCYVELVSFLTEELIKLNNLLSCSVSISNIFYVMQDLILNKTLLLHLIKQLLSCKYNKYKYIFHNIFAIAKIDNNITTTAVTITTLIIPYYLTKLYTVFISNQISYHQSNLILI